MTFTHKLSRRLAMLYGTAAALAAASLVVNACEQPLSGPSTEVAQLVVSPKSVSVQLNQSASFTSVGLTADGDTVSVAVTWKSSGGAVTDAGSSANGKRHYGQWKHNRCGTFSVWATAERFGKADTSSATVLCPVAMVEVTPAAATVLEGETVQLTATPKDTAGNAVTGASVTWTSSAPAVATVSPTGLVSGVAAGSATITATGGGQSGSATITVNRAPVASVDVTPPSASVQVGLTVQLSATPRGAGGQPLAGRTVSWSSSNASIASVTASGLVAGVAVGSATITATSEGQSGTSAITVTAAPAPVASVTVSPASATLQVGQTQQLAATTKDGSGNILTGRTVTWSSSNSTIASVNGSGLVTAAGAGSATITATSEGQTGSAAITVTLAPVATVTVSPASASIQVGQTQPFTATLKDASGNILTGRTVSWSSSNSTIASVNGSTGVATGVAAGSATITATSEGQNGTAAITVTAAPVPVAAVTVSPATASLLVGQTQQLAATTTDASGNILTGRTVSWSSSNSSVASVNSSGLVTAASAGSATITATSEGKSGTSAITVTVPVASVTVSPATASLFVGQTQQLTATTKDASGNILTGRTVSWSSSNSSVASVNSSGLVTAAGAGSATITATSEGKSGTSAITVTLAPVATVTVSPATVSLQVGQTQQLTATTKDANGNVLTGRSVSWSSNAGSVASVNSSGLVTAAGAGSATITATSEGKSGTAAVTVTAPSSGSVVLVGAGDIADCNASATAALINNLPSATVFTAGDNAYPDGSSSDYANCYDPSWGKFKSRTWPSPGNHDYHTSGASGYFNYFGSRAPAQYYSYDIGAWHVISLNSEISVGAGSSQEKWLRSDLAASTKRCTIAYWHKPLFSSGANHGSDNSYQALWQALYDFGAEIVITGHDHEYERFGPQTASGQADAAKGIREFVVGTGGAGLYSFASPLPNSEKRDANSHGVLKLTLSDGSYTWEFIPVSGDSFHDSGSGTCH